MKCKKSHCPLCHDGFCEYNLEPICEEYCKIISRKYEDYFDTPFLYEDHDEFFIRERKILQKLWEKHNMKGRKK